MVTAAMLQYCRVLESMGGIKWGLTDSQTDSHTDTATYWKQAQYGACFKNQSHIQTNSPKKLNWRNSLHNVLFRERIFDRNEDFVTIFEKLVITAFWNSFQIQNISIFVEVMLLPSTL